jgi:hypothetical protein
MDADCPGGGGWRGYLGGNELAWARPLVDPAAQVLVLNMPVRGHQQPALPRPPRQVERPGARLGQGRLGLVGGHPHDQVLAAHPAGHVAVHQEGEPTEHLLLGQPGLVAEHLPDAGGETFVVRHGQLADFAFGLPQRPIIW